LGEEGRDELLFAMYLAARDNAREHLSEAGREVLEMVEYASRHTGLGVTDAWREASATSRLSEYDNDILKAFVARVSLIDAFSEAPVAEE
jgi:hypothetical protein